jgi:transaldolase
MNSGEPSGHLKNDHLENHRENGSQYSSHQANDQTAELEEARKIRRLQIMMGMVSSVISQDPSLTIEEASELAASAKRAALAMFPDKELAYDLLYKPRLQRLMCERFRLQ